MTGEQIKTLIEVKNQEIKELLSPNCFILNNFLRNKLVEIEELQKQCPHKWDEDGFCIYCNLLMEDTEE